MAQGGSGFKLFVGSLPTDVCAEELQMVFSTYGEVNHVHVMNPHPKTGQRCAFIFYNKHEAADDAIKVLDGIYKIREDAERPIEVRWAKGDPGAVGSSEGGMSHDGESGWHGAHARSSGANVEDGHKLFIGSLPSDIHEEELRMVFATYGEVIHVHVMNPHPRTGLRCAFVFYARQDSAEDAIKVLDGIYKIREDALEPIQVRWANKESRGAKGKGEKGEGKGWGQGKGSWDQNWGGKSGWQGQAALGWQGSGSDWQDGKGGNWQSSSNWQDGNSWNGGGSWSGDAKGRGKKGWIEEPTHGNRLYVANLPEDIQESALEYVFGTYGKVEKVHIMAGKSKNGCISAFVELSSAEDAETAIQSLHEKYEIRPGFGPLVVKYALARPPRAAPY